ncbi:MAG: hypothetical protein KAW49_04975 [Anaerolineae bacterium]|jgi:hypothetical protein|nr:hypothetical protein [Anaerolineae bacterium]MCK4471120.1 hypothetical protein [Anaerolineae bacterium]
MAPTIGRLAFTIGFSVFLLALIMLPCLDPGSAEFVADVLALLLSGTFLGLVVWSVRRAVRLPTPDDAPPADEQRDAPPDEEQRTRN